MMPSPTSRSFPPTSMTNYGSGEVQWLVEDYAELVHKKQHLGILVRLLDLDAALKKLSRPHYQAVLLCGMMGLTVREVEAITSVNYVTIHRRYHRAIAELTANINGGRTLLRERST